MFLVLKDFISSNRNHLFRCARFLAGLFHSRVLREEKFPIKEQSAFGTSTPLPLIHEGWGCFLLTYPA